MARRLDTGKRPKRGKTRAPAVLARKCPLGRDIRKVKREMPREELDQFSPLLIAHTKTEAVKPRQMT